MWKLCSYLIVFFFMSAVHSQPYVEKDEKGWLWYREEALIPNQGKPAKPENKEKKAPKTNADRIDQMRKDFDEILATALLKPTIENVTRAKHKQLEFEDKSTEFAKMWVLSHVLESKGYSQTGNPHAWHQEIAEKEHEKTLHHNLRELAKSHGLFFAFKQSCPYCHRFAPVVAEFAQKYGFELKAISKEGGTIKGIQNVSKDNGALSVVNPEGVYPALFLANPRTMQVMPIAWGMVTIDQLLKNVETVLPYLGGQS